MKKRLAGALSIFLVLLFILVAAYLISRVPKSPPVAKFDVSSTTVNIEDTIFFSANKSSDSDGRIVSYYWNFGDGENESGKYVSHSYEEGGTYNVILIVSDDENMKAIKNVTIYVNFPPVPIINISSPAYIHEDVNFWGNDSYDPDGYIIDYFWRFGDGGNASNDITTHIYHDLGIFNGYLTVVDNLGASSTGSFQVMVINRTYHIKWKIASHGVFWQQYRHLDEGDSLLVTREITYCNMTKLVFNLTWDDDIPILGPPNDEFMINITSPDGFSQEKSENDQLISISFPTVGTMNEVPEDFDMGAETIEILEQILADMFTSDNGMGEWEVNITLVDAPGIINGPIDTDDGNDFIMSVSCLYYVAEITVVD